MRNTPPVAPQASTEAPVQRADIHVSSPAGVHVTITDTAQSSDLWHRVLNELHDLGIMAGISDSAYRVLGSFLRLNCSRTGSLDARTGLVFADVDKLMAATRRSRTYVYKGRSELLSHPRSLLAERERDRYLVLPGWSWAGRGEPPVPSPRPRIFQSPVGDAKSPMGDGSSAIGDGRCAPLRERARGLNSETDLDSNNNSRAVVVGLLLGAGIGFKANEAASLAGLPDVDEARAVNAIAGARRVRDAGKLKIDKHRDADHCMRSWISGALERKWNLFDQAAADRYAEERAAADRGKQVAELAQRMERVMSAREIQDVKEAFTGWDDVLASGALPSHWLSLTPLMIREKVLNAGRAREKAGAAS